MVGENSYFDNDANSVVVTLNYATDAGQLAYEDGWLGINERSGASGDEVAFSIENCARQITYPSGFDVAKGDDIWVTVSGLSGTNVPSTFSNAPGTGKIYLGKAAEAKDANHVAITHLAIKNQFTGT